MLFPHPRSSRVLVRKTIAAIIGEAGNIFAGEVETFLAEEARVRRGDYEKVEFVCDQEDAGKASLKERRVRKIAKKVLGVSVCSAFVFIASEIGSESSLCIDKIDVYLSVSNHCQVRTPVLVRILMFPYLRIVFYKLTLLIVGLGLMIYTKNCLCCSGSTNPSSKFVALNVFCVGPEY